MYEYMLLVSFPGSISLSEGSSSESEEEQVVIDRPQNPSPGQQKRMVFQKVPSDLPRPTDDNVINSPPHGRNKTKSLENVIDELFLQTQKNIDSIYRNGLDNMDIETYRSDTVTPETCIKRMDTDLFKPTVTEGELTAEKRKNSKNSTTENNRNSVTHGMNKLQVTDIESEGVTGNGSPEMDSLLTEVSIWAKDRQNWLLEDGKLKTGASKETTETSLCDDKAIASVSKSNNERCMDWVDSVAKSGNGNVEVEAKVNGILTGPKLFRSVSRGQNSRKVSFSDTDSNKANQGRDTRNSSRRGFNDNQDKLSRDVTQLESIDSKRRDGSEPWTTDMYNNRSRSREDDRSTINDNLSELDRQTPFRARSPESWLSSNGSCSNLLKPDLSRDDRDEFVVSSPFRNTPEMSVKRTASEPAKSHQIIRKKPVIHSPFATFSRQHTPMPNESTFIATTPMKPMIKNTQLKPLSMQLMGNFQERQFPGFKSNHMLNDPRSFTDAHITAASNPRPFSEIPVRDSFGANDKLLISNTTSSIANNVAVSLTRPVSETAPQMKRTDKIGMGNIMATDSMKERNKYARDIVKSLSMTKPVISTDAFQTSSSGNAKATETSKQKKHTVFNQKLLNGGYTYEKHSRKHTSGSRDEFLDLTAGYYDPNEDHLPDIRKSEGAINSPRSTNSASVSELTVNIKDSYSGRNGMKPTVITKETMNQMFSGNRHTVDVNIGANNTEQDASNGQKTAAKFKRLRSRRDQEMEWLMKDAAETEV